MHVIIVACLPLFACCTLFLCFLALQSLSLMILGEAMMILYIKDHVCSGINDFRERIRAITNTSSW